MSKKSAAKPVKAEQAGEWRQGIQNLVLSELRKGISLATDATGTDDPPKHRALIRDAGRAYQKALLCLIESQVTITDQLVFENLQRLESLLRQVNFLR